MKLTQEQDTIITAFEQGRDLRVQAGAGCGKSSTLIEAAKARPEQDGLFIAYNRAIKDDMAAKAPISLEVATSHSLAFRAVGVNYKHRLNGPRLPVRETARQLGVKAFQIGDHPPLGEFAISRMVNDMVRRFMYSADEGVSTSHVDPVTGYNPVEMQELAATLVPLARRAWADLSSVDGKLRFEHDCQPPGTLVRRVVRGMPVETEEVPIEQIREGDKVVSLTMGKRLGYVRRSGRAVTAAGYRDYSGELITVMTARGRQSSYTDSHKCVVRLDTDLTEGNHVVYLMRQGDDYRIGRTTWRTSSQGNTLGIRRRAEGQHADAVWVLSVHETNEEAALAEALAAHRWNIPMWQFHSIHKAPAVDLETLWSKIGNNGAAAGACLAAHGRDIRFPFWSKGDGWSNTRTPVVLRAVNLLSGMKVLEPDEITPDDKGALFAHDGYNGWSPVTVTHSQYDGPVYSLDVDTDHTYVADGIVTHNCYFKLWALSGPKLHGDYLLTDEAQDLNPALVAVVNAQTHMQRVAVGDSCQPSGTLVTVIRKAALPVSRTAGGRYVQHITDAVEIPIEQVQEGDQVVSYAMESSFLRRTGSRVAGISARPFEGNLIRITLADGTTSAYTPDHHCLVHIGPALAGKYVLYVMRRGDDYRVGMTTGQLESQGNSAGVALRAKAEGADAFWILDTFDTRAEATVAEAVAAWTYGVPDIIFRSANGMPQESLDLIWSKIGGNRDNAVHLLASYGRSIEFPLLETKNSSLLMRRAKVIRACNLLEGMTVLPLSGAMDAEGKRAGKNRWEQITITREPYAGSVWSMTVEGDHTYVGDGIVTHNCQSIYGWRGATDALDHLAGDQLTLSQSFRFGPAIAHEANDWLDVLGAPIRLKGFDPIESRVTTFDPEAGTVLCRTNMGAMAEAIELLDQGHKVSVVGGAKQLQDLANACLELQESGKTTHPELLAFDGWDDVREYAEDKAGADLKPMVDLVDRYSPKFLLARTRQFTEMEQYADRIVSTAHKAKGREWPSVRLASDFRREPDEETGVIEITREFAMLCYVTVTRAKQTLAAESLDWFKYQPVVISA